MDSAADRAPVVVVVGVPLAVATEALAGRRTRAILALVGWERRRGCVARRGRRACGSGDGSVDKLLVPFMRELVQERLVLLSRVIGLLSSRVDSRVVAVHRGDRSLVDVVEVRDDLPIQDPEVEVERVEDVKVEGGSSEATTQ